MKKVSKKMSRVEVKQRSFSGFNVSLQTGSRRKQRLSNHLAIEVDADKASVQQKLTLREARALQRWLNDNLPVESA